MNHPDELIRQILAPRPLTRLAPIASPPPKPARHASWCSAVVLTVLAAAAGGVWLWYSADGKPRAASPAIEEAAPARAEGALVAAAGAAVPPGAAVVTRGAAPASASVPRLGLSEL